LCVAGVDTLLASLAMVVLFAVTGWGPRPAGVWVVAIAPVEVAFAAGVSLALSAVLVYVRDMTILLPILLQLGLFASPVAWPFSQIPAWLRPAYAVANPLGPVIDSVRRTLLGGRAPDPLLLGLAAAGALAFLAGGYALFKRAEVGFADTA
ncbi:MAG TPA: ABC transporter permease, partial [Acidimicrobiales bacterium]|nr:ABC transporter permease [Acidimicrobiales bacterium]